MRISLSVKNITELMPLSLVIFVTTDYDKHNKTYVANIA